MQFPNFTSSVCRRPLWVNRVVGQDITQQYTAFVLTRLDYCNSLLSGLPRSNIQPLQRVMNAAARVVIGLVALQCQLVTMSNRHSSSSIGYQSNSESRTSYVFWFTTVHYIHTGQAPQYLSKCVSTISSSGNRYRLRSCDGTRLHTAENTHQVWRTWFPLLRSGRM